MEKKQKNRTNGNENKIKKINRKIAEKIQEIEKEIQKNNRKIAEKQNIQI